MIDRATAPPDLVADINRMSNAPYYDSRGIPNPNVAPVVHAPSPQQQSYAPQQEQMYAAPPTAGAVDPRRRAADEAVCVVA